MCQAICGGTVQYSIACIVVSNCTFLAARTHLAWRRSTFKLSVASIQLPIHHPWPHTTPSLFVRHCDTCAHAIDQCPGWIVFAVCGSYARGSMDWRLRWVSAGACICLKEKSPGASLHPWWCRFSPHGEEELHPMSLPGGDNPQSLTLTLCSPDHFTLGRLTSLIWIWFEKLTISFYFYLFLF